MLKQTFHHVQNVLILRPFLLIVSHLTIRLGTPTRLNDSATCSAWATETQKQQRRLPLHSFRDKLLPRHSVIVGLSIASANCPYCNPLLFFDG